jgi:hypothetical protein
MSWQKVDTAPQDGRWLVMWLGQEPAEILRWSGWRWEDGSDDSYQEYRPTYWMPHPDPPTHDYYTGSLSSGLIFTMRGARLDGGIRYVITKMMQPVSDLATVKVWFRREDNAPFVSPPPQYESWMPEEDLRRFLIPCR